MPRRLFAALVVGLFAASSLAQKTPEETVRSMTVADGLQVELFAAEPMLLNPTSIDVDHLGRVWVCEGVNYRRIGFKRPILRDAGDRIVILADKDGDGKADDSTVFYQGKEIIAPLGIAVAATPVSPPRKQGSFSYKVFVCQSPDILLFEDADGDGKADGPPKKFLTGFNGFDHDHGVHGITIGPDGKLYFTVGDSGVKGLQSSDGKGRAWTSNSTDCRAGTVWRCDFDGTNLELIAHNFRNNYEACVNSFGEVWLSDNDDDGNQQTRICFVMPGGNYGYHPRGPGQSHWHEEQPGVVHKALRAGFGSPTGICFYEGTLLPEKYRGQLLHTDAGPRELRCFHIKPKGAGYELTQENLVTSTDNWFRLSDVCVAPDGSVILADWYDPGVGGHGMGDWTRGRIYRVTPKGHKGYKVPSLNLDHDDDLLAGFKNPNLAMRSMVLSQLAKAEQDQSFSVLINALRVDDGRRTAARAISAAPKLHGWRDAQALVWKVLNDRKVPELHAAALRVAEQQAAPRTIADLFDGGLKPALRDWMQAASGNQKLTLLVALRNFEATEAARLFYEMAHSYDGQDHFYRAALNIACGTDPKRREAILADFDKHFPEWNDKVADLVWELRPASFLPRLGKLLDDPKLTPAQKGRIVDILAVNDDPAAGSALLKLLGREVPPEMKGRALENLRTFLPTKWAKLKQGEEVRSAINNLLKSKEHQIAGLQLAASAPDCCAFDDIIGLARDDKAAGEVRTEAIRTLGKIPNIKTVEALIELGVPQNPLSIECVKALGHQLPTGSKSTPAGQRALEALQLAIELPRASMEIKQAALMALAGTPSGTDWLLKQQEQKKLPENLVADAGRLLRNSPFQGHRNRALLLFPAPGKLDPKKLPSPAELAKRQGDAKRGEAVFKASLRGESQCLRCHTVRGVGGNIGPDLSMVGKKGSKENLFESVLLPSKAIADQHVQWKVDTVDMKSVIGLLVAESDTQITLRDANGKDHTFATRDLDGPKQKSLVSIMPDNLVAALTEDELIDMVEYMLTLKTASLTPETWHILGPFDNDGADAALDKDLGLETAKTIDLTAAHKGKDGPIKWGTAKVNGSGYLDLMAHHAGKSPHSASYLYRVIESPADQDGVILFGNDDGAKIWMSGEKVFENREHLAASPERHKVPVKLKKGANAVLIKIVNGNDPHGFYFALTSEQELKGK
jgi:putative membrane-bound dehydrogenase-like protein